MSSDPRPPTIAFGIRKLPARAASWVLPLILSIFMTCVVSLISTLRGVGLTPQLPALWLGSWALSWVVAFPTLLVVLPWVRKATAALVDVA